MNKTPAEAAELAKALRRNLSRYSDVDIVLGPTYVALPAVIAEVADSPLGVAGQNLHWEPKGAYTGEISGPMLKSLGCDYVIIGHSERRQYFGETEESVNKRIRAAFDAGLTPILCVGESLEAREAGNTQSVVGGQVEGGLAGFSSRELQGLVVAYEPVWAIGTGRTATDEQAQEVHAFIRNLLETLFDSEFAQATRIQYGGSVKPGNVAGLMSQTDIDGALVGGASLSADTFTSLVQNAR